MGALAKLARGLARLAKPTPSRKKGKPPLPENPYRRFYTKNRSFEELTRPKFPKK